MPDPTDQHPDDIARLLDFVRDRDAACPICGYNLRALTQPVCPECRQPLSLTVGAPHLRFGWFVITIIPGIFSGMAATLLLIPFIGMTVTGNGPPPWPMLVLDAFGWTSGIVTAALILKRYAFLRRPPERQRTWALAAWLIHLTAFGILILAVLW